MIRTPVHVLFAALLAIVQVGCLTVGQAGVLAFDYDAKDRFLGRDGPDTALAVGGYVDLNVYARRLPPLPPAGEEGLLAAPAPPRGGPFDPVEVSRALSSIPGVARVEEPAGPRVRVYGVSPGQATITVESASGNDTVVLSVAHVDAATVDHWLAEVVGAGRSGERFAAEAAFVQGGTGRFIVSMRDASGRAVVGAGVTPPIEIEPPGAAFVAPIADGDLRHAELRFDGAGPVELRTLRRAPFRVLVVPPASVKELELAAVDLKAPGLEEISSLREGEERGVAVRGVLPDGRRVVLLGDVARVTSATPEVCVTPVDVTEQARRMFGDGLCAVKAVAPGACTLVASLEALRAEITVAVSAKAEAGSGGEADAQHRSDRPRP